ncbi:right-handed parallel beta-helix repeat-containing protein [Microbacterium oxydans]|uniref:right-handed parallel beta-helix repeat-containing protein n=1 Tax=Microbacterium oxydans TaxID=82380 RepID=UPI000B8666FD|nr:right-handed parallel beta-helix repeat-containing protein [Microbacterium oxydans]
MNRITAAPRRGPLLVAVVLAAVLGAGAIASSPAVAAPSIRGPVPALLAPTDLETGDPEPPDDTPVPDGLDEPSPVPDETVVEFPPPPAPNLIPNANTVRMAWVGTPAQRPADSALLTLQAAITAAPADGVVSFVPSDYAFTGALTVTRAVTLDTSAASTLYTRFTVSAGGLQLADDVTVGVASTGATISVTGADVAIREVAVRNPNAVARPTGIQVGAGLTGIVIDGFTMDGGGVVSSYGINLTTGSATITDAEVSGVATGVAVTAASTAGGIVVTGGSFTSATAGISLGAATAPQVSGVEVTGTAGTGTGIDLANSNGARVELVSVDGFARGIGTATTNASAGATITDATITGASREGIALGATTGASIVRADITGTGAVQSTGILTLRSTSVRIDAPTITGMMYGITTHVDNDGEGPEIIAPRITAFGGITLGSTQRASVTDPVLDAGTWGESGTGINLVNAGRVTVTGVQATGFLYAIGSQSSFTPESDRADIRISDVRADGAPDASSGIYLLGVTNATISDVDAELTGAALVIHQSIGVRAQDIVVHGRSGLTPVTGAAILRAYGSQDVHVDRASIDAGSYGFFYSATSGATVQNATVAGVVERALYGRSVSNLDVGSSTFTGNAAVGAFVVTTPENGISHDIVIHDNVMTDNDGGIHVLQGTTATQVVRNTVSGQSDVVTAGGAHDLLVAENDIDHATDGVGVRVAPLWEDGAEAGSYSSSDVRVRDNVFTGVGTSVVVGTADPASPEGERRTLRDPVLVVGNTFDPDSTAVRTFPNAVVGADAAAGVERSLPGDGPVAVDARNHDDPNDWGSECLATGYLDDALFYGGGGAAVYELTEAPVLYPMNCIDLSLQQTLELDDDQVLAAGDTLTWTLMPQNIGPRAAPAGWSITQLLPDGVELVSMSGDGYTVDGLTATAAEELPAGADGPVLSVVVRIVSVPAGTETMRNVAYVAPAGITDLDGDGFDDVVFEQLNPLEVPTIDTDTEASATDNDAQGVWAVRAGSDPSGGGGGGGSGGGTGGGLAFTGADAAPGLAAGVLLLLAGLTLAMRRRPRV